MPRRAQSGERDVLLKLDTRDAEFIGHKDILQKAEDKEETNKDHPAQNRKL